MKGKKSFKILLKLLMAILSIAAIAYCVSFTNFIVQLIVLAAAGITILCFLFAKKITLKAMSLLLAVSIGLSGIFIGSVSLLNHLEKNTSYNVPVVTRSEIYSNKNVMIISPHEDDELNMASGIIKQFDDSCTIRIAFTTNGDGYNLGETRVAEAINVAKTLGIPEKNVMFLGYGSAVQGHHIYLASPNEVVTSAIGRTKTYAISSHPPYKSNNYTRNNILSDVKSVISVYKPDTIICVDADFHADHKAASLLCEEAMADILKSNTNYHPTVYKSFAYVDAYYSAPDYYADNILSTQKDYNCDYLAYNWNDRIRYPVSSENLARTQYSSYMYNIFNLYPSQDYIAQFSSVINSDTVFFERKTTSLLYNSKITSTSGDTTHLTDFKLWDIDEMNPKGIVSINNWTPAAADKKKSFTVTLDKPQNISEIYLYDNISKTDNVLDATVSFSDGSSISTGSFAGDNNTAKCLKFKIKKNITSITVSIKKSEGNKAGFSEIEAYASSKAKLKFAKIVDSKDNFVYDYWLKKDSESEKFSVYEYDAVSDGSIDDNYDIKLSSDDNCSYKCEGGNIYVNCPKGSKCTLKIINKNDSSVYDEINISNPKNAVRYYYKFLQAVEKHIPYNLSDLYSPSNRINYYIYNFKVFVYNIIH